MANTIPKRSEIPEQYTWDLSGMFESDDKWFEEYEALKDAPQRIAAYKGRLSESAETLLEFMRLDDAFPSFTAMQTARAIRTPPTAFIRICAARR